MLAVVSVNARSTAVSGVASVPVYERYDEDAPAVADTRQTANNKRPHLRRPAIQHFRVFFFITESSDPPSICMQPPTGCKSAATTSSSTAPVSWRRSDGPLSFE